MAQIHQIFFKYHPGEKSPRIPTEFIKLPHGSIRAAVPYLLREKSVLCAVKPIVHAEISFPALIQKDSLIARFPSKTRAPE